MNGQCHGKGDKLINIGHIYILTDLDIGNYRQPHLKPNVRVKPTYVRAGEGHMRQGLQGQADSSHQGTDGEVVAVVVVVVDDDDDDMKLLLSRRVLCTPYSGICTMPLHAKPHT